jgi:nitric oxide reductase large subunit
MHVLTMPLPLVTATIFLSGGIIGTLHHLYFSGTPTLVLALGSVFSALEVVPLLFVGFEAREGLKLSHAKPWVRHYRWPIYFFVAVAFWNLVGAGLFGFMIKSADRPVLHAGPEHDTSSMVTQRCSASTGCSAWA